MNDNADEENFCFENQTTTYGYLTSEQMPPFGFAEH